MGVFVVCASYWLLLTVVAAVGLNEQSIVAQRMLVEAGFDVCERIAELRLPVMDEAAAAGPPGRRASSAGGVVELFESAA